MALFILALLDLKQFARTQTQSLYKGVRVKILLLLRCVLALLLSTSLHCINVQNLKLIYFKGSMLRVLLRASRASCQFPHQAWLHYIVSSSISYLCWGDSGASLLTAGSYLRHHILLLNSFLYCFCTFGLASGNILQIFFNVTRCCNSLFQPLLEWFSIEFFGKTLWSVCLMAELLPET